MEALSSGILDLEALWTHVVSHAREDTDSERARLDQLSRRATIAPLSAIDRCDHQLRHIEQIVPALAERSVRHSEDELRHALTTLVNRPRQIISAAEERLRSFESTIRAYDPAHALARGWSITRTTDGEIANASTLQSGDGLVTQLAGGTVTSTVEEVEPTS